MRLACAGLLVCAFGCSGSNATSSHRRSDPAPTGDPERTAAPQSANEGAAAGSEQERFAARERADAGTLAAEAPPEHATLVDGGTVDGAPLEPEQRSDAGEAPGAEREAGPDTAERQLARGRRAFVRACQQCHPGGRAGKGPRLIGKRLPAAQVARQIRGGLGRMKPIPPARLPADELGALMVFLRSIRAVRDGPPQ